MKVAIHAQGSLYLQIGTGPPERFQMADMNGHHNTLRQDDTNNESDGEDEGERTLLGLEPSQKYMKPPIEENTWSFVRGILLEVSSVLPLVLQAFKAIQDGSNIVINDGRTNIYWRAVGTSCCM